MRRAYAPIPQRPLILTRAGACVHETATASHVQIDQRKETRPVTLSHRASNTRAGGACRFSAYCERRSDAIEAIDSWRDNV
jgi:hypothetical protein